MSTSYPIQKVLMERDVAPAKERYCTNVTQGIWVLAKGKQGFEKGRSLEKRKYCKSVKDVKVTFSEKCVTLPLWASHKIQFHCKNLHTCPPWGIGELKCATFLLHKHIFGLWTLYLNQLTIIKLLNKIYLPNCWGFENIKDQRNERQLAVICLL